MLTKKKTALSLVIPQSRDRNQLILENDISIEFKDRGATVGNEGCFLTEDRVEDDLVTSALSTTLMDPKHPTLLQS